MSAGYNKLSEQELITLLKDGDQCAYTEIFERYKTVLYKHAYRLLNDREEANDVIQDLFIKLWEKRESIVFRSSLSAYLFNAVRNRIFDHISHQKVVAKYINSIRDFTEANEIIIDEQIRIKEMLAVIDKEIAALPAKMREVLMLSRQEELPYKEIGRMLNISDKTVKQQVYNATKILKVKLAHVVSVLLFF